MSKLPPVNMLLAVEAATRLGSFKLAADELNLTPSAVSHRIKAVEAQLGSPLFRRIGQGIEPLANAREIAEAVLSATLSLKNAWDMIEAAHAADRLKVSSVSSFASRFILPDMSGMQAKFENVSLELTSRNDINGLEQGLHDICIRSGQMPAATGIWSEAILEGAFLPVVAERVKSQAFSNGMLHGPLFAFHTLPDVWDRVAPMFDFTVDPTAITIRFETFELACEAAGNGGGIALVPEWVAAGAIAAGRVVPLVKSAIRPNWHYWIAMRRGEELLPARVAFHHWVKGQIHKAVGDSQRLSQSSNNA